MGAKRPLRLVYINLACQVVCLFICLSVCLYPIKSQNGWTDRAQIFCGTSTPGKFYEWSKFQIFFSIKIRSSLNFKKFWKSTKFFCENLRIFSFCFTMHTKRWNLKNLSRGLNLSKPRLHKCLVKIIIP